MSVDLSDTILAKSDQLNADDLIAGPMTVTVTKVGKIRSPDQPVTIHYDGEQGKPWKPCLTMRRVLVLAWGKNGAQYVGRRITLYREPSVLWGGKPVGGIRISHLSHIEGEQEYNLTATRGKKELWRVEPLHGEGAPSPSWNDDDFLQRLAACQAPEQVKALVEGWPNATEDHRNRARHRYAELRDAAKAPDPATEPRPTPAEPEPTVATDREPPAPSEPPPNADGDPRPVSSGPEPWSADVVANQLKQAGSAEEARALLRDRNVAALFASDGFDHRQFLVLARELGRHFGQDANNILQDFVDEARSAPDG
ncbi:MAG: hypothetical protein AAFX81_16490 [Pseudomonadota bacterium]